MRAWISSKERSGMAGWLWGGGWLGWMAELISVPGLIYRGKWVLADRLWAPQAARLPGCKAARMTAGPRALRGWRYLGRPCIRRYTTDG